MVGALLEAGEPLKQRHNVVFEGGAELLSPAVWRGWTQCSWHSPSLNLEQTALLGKLPQVLATASYISPAPGLPHLTQLPWVHGGANRAAEVPQEVTGVGESAQHTEAGRAVGVGHQPLVRALGCAD